MDKIYIETGPVAFSSAGIQKPEAGVEGKFSLWFLAALALAEGNVSLDKFTNHKVRDPMLQKLLSKVDAHLVRERKFGALVQVHMTDGSMIEKTREHPKGSPQNPLSFEEIEGKFQSTAALHLNQKRTLELIEQVRRLDELKDVSSLAQSLST